MTELFRNIVRVTLVCALLLSQTALPADAQARDSVRPPRGEVSGAAPESLRRKLDALSPREQRVVKRRLRNMPAQRRARFFERWDSLDEREREALIERFRARIDRREGGAAHDRAGDVRRDSDRVERNRRAWREMRRGDRERMKTRLRRFKELSPEQQRRVVDRRFKDRTAEERRRILERLRAASERLD